MSEFVTEHHASRATISPDRRRIEAVADAEGERIVAEIAAEYLDVRLRFARALLRIERGRTFALSACSSVVQYAMRLGVPASEARALVDIGRALEAPCAADPDSATGGEEVPQPPSVEARIRSGRLAVENAAVAGRLLAQPGLVLPGEDWIKKAESLRAPELRRQVQARIEQAAQGVASLVQISVHITEATRDEFRRARALASREAAFRLTEGQAFTRVVRFYLDAVDELRGGLGTGTRRVASTDPTQQDSAVGGRAPRGRRVPADVRRAILERSGDHCEVHGCTHDTFLEFAHIEPHVGGGSRESGNLLRICHAHHTQLDAGCLIFGGWCDEGGTRRPRFTDASGEGFAQRPLQDTAAEQRPLEAAAGEPDGRTSQARISHGPVGGLDDRHTGELTDWDDAPGTRSHDWGDDRTGPCRVAEPPPPCWSGDGGGGPRPPPGSAHARGDCRVRPRTSRPVRLVHRRPSLARLPP